MLTLLAHLGYGYDAPQTRIVRAFYGLLLFAIVAAFAVEMSNKIAILSPWGTILIWLMPVIAVDTFASGHVASRVHRQRLQKTVNEMSEQVETLKGEAERLNASQFDLRKNLGH